MNLKTQKILAAKVLGVGITRVKINTEMHEEISQAITREDIKRLIAMGAITVKPVKGISTYRLKKKKAQKAKGRQSGHGSRGGTKNAREPSKRSWIKKIRAIRDELNKMKAEKKIDRSTYRKAYLQAKGNLFHGRKHLREHLEKE